MDKWISQLREKVCTVHAPTSSSESSPNTEVFCRIDGFDPPFFCGKISPYLWTIRKKGFLNPVLQNSTMCVFKAIIYQFFKTKKLVVDLGRTQAPVAPICIQNVILFILYIYSLNTLIFLPSSIAIPLSTNYSR